MEIVQLGWRILSITENEMAQTQKDIQHTHTHAHKQPVTLNGNFQITILGYF